MIPEDMVLRHLFNGGADIRMRPVVDDPFVQQEPGSCGVFRRERPQDLRQHLMVSWIADKFVSDLMDRLDKRLHEPLAINLSDGVSH